MTETTAKETFGFQAEAKQLLNLMIHSVYSNKEIFLRELVSNASDACEQLRFEALSDSALFEDEQELTIRVGFDEQARTVIVTDNGIGMSRQEVVEHIGTIARSGTQEFLRKLTGDQTRDAQLIGQFGVGFYSAFVVAERVTLVTRRAGLTAEHGVRWESVGEGEYTLETVRKETRGTEVILHLRQGEDELLSSGRLRDLLRKYSDHIALPILMQKEGGDASPEDEKVNQASALWARPKSEISEEQYQEFYKHVAHDFEPALAYTHAKVEGRQEYTVLLFVPQRAPFDLWDRAQRHGIKLYVRRVFHHGRRRAVDAGLPAFRPGRGRLERPPPQPLPRAAAALSGRGIHSSGVGEADSRNARGARRERRGQVHQLLARVRSGVQGRGR